MMATMASIRRPFSSTSRRGPAPSLTTSLLDLDDLPLAPATHPLLPPPTTDHHHYDDEEDMMMRMLMEDNDVTGPNKARSLYYLPSPPRAAPTTSTLITTHSSSSSASFIAAAAPPPPSVDSSPPHRSATAAAAAAAIDFTALYSVPEPYAPSIYPTIHEPAPPTYREFSSNRGAFTTISGSRSRTTSSSSSSFSATHAYTRSSSQQQQGAVIMERSTSVEVEEVPKYVQCLACDQWLQVVSHAHLVYCPTCTSITTAMHSNTRWPTTTTAHHHHRRDRAFVPKPLAQLFTCLGNLLRL